MPEFGVAGANWCSLQRACATPEVRFGAGCCGSLDAMMQLLWLYCDAPLLAPSSFAGYVEEMLRRCTLEHGLRAI